MLPSVDMNHSTTLLYSYYTIQLLHRCTYTYTYTCGSLLQRNCASIVIYRSISLHHSIP